MKKKKAFLGTLRLRTVKLNMDSLTSRIFVLHSLSHLSVPEMNRNFSYSRTIYSKVLVMARCCSRSKRGSPWLKKRIRFRKVVKANREQRTSSIEGAEKQE